MNSKQMTILALGAALLAGCAPTRGDYAAYVTALQGSQNLQRAEMKNCHAFKMSDKERKATALVLDTTEAKAQSTLCTRVLNGLTSGKLSYDDYVAVTHHNISPKVIRILQGRKP